MFDANAILAVRVGVSTSTVDQYVAQPVFIGE
jgi:hypothetical protein